MGLVALQSSNDLPVWLMQVHLDAAHSHYLFPGSHRSSAAHWCVASSISICSVWAGAYSKAVTGSLAAVLLSKIWATL